MTSGPTSRRTSNAFGSPGTDSTVKRLDLNDAFIKHPDATFIVRAAGDAMQGAGIADGDILLVDRSLTASHGAVVIAVVEGDLICRRLERAGDARSGGEGRGDGALGTRFIRWKAARFTCLRVPSNDNHIR